MNDALPAHREHILGQVRGYTMRSLAPAERVPGESPTPVSGKVPDANDRGARGVGRHEAPTFQARKSRSNNKRQRLTADNAALFTHRLPGPEGPFGNPGGAWSGGHVAADEKS